MRLEPTMADPKHPRYYDEAFKRQIVQLYESGKPSRKIRRRGPTSSGHRAGLLQRQARGVRQQDQGHHPHGLRLPPRHQPHRPGHAQMRRTRHPTATTRNLTHKNIRSLREDHCDPWGRWKGAVMSERTCNIAGCHNPAESNGLCAHHFTRALGYGQLRVANHAASLSGAVPRGEA